jgi:hypothetical protein
MANARSILTPLFDLYRNQDCIAIQRDSFLLRIYPKEIKFQIDRLE